MRPYMLGCGTSSHLRSASGLSSPEAWPPGALLPAAQAVAAGCCAEQDDVTSAPSGGGTAAACSGGAAPAAVARAAAEVLVGQLGAQLRRSSEQALAEQSTPDERSTRQQQQQQQRHQADDEVARSSPPQQSTRAEPHQSREARRASAQADGRQQAPPHTGQRRARRDSLAQAPACDGCASASEARGTPVAPSSSTAVTSTAAPWAGAAPPHSGSLALEPETPSASDPQPGCTDYWRQTLGNITNRRRRRDTTRRQPKPVAFSPADGEGQAVGPGSAAAAGRRRRTGHQQPQQRLERDPPPRQQQAAAPECERPRGAPNDMLQPAMLSFMRQASPGGYLSLFTVAWLSSSLMRPGQAPVKLESSFCL